MRTLAIDPGEKRIGLALSDETGALARPLTVVAHEARDQDAARVAALAHEHGAEQILLGLATDAEGEVGPQARRAQRFAEALRAHTELPIIFWDESFTTQQAHSTRRAQNKRAKTPVDALAAAHLLQDYLDAQRETI